MFRSAGAFLTLASLLRIFPALFVAGYARRQLRLGLRGESLDPGFRRFSVSDLVTGIVLLFAGAAVSGRGPGVYLEFSKRISTLTASIANNGLGLKPLLAYRRGRSKPELVDGMLTFRIEAIQKRKREVLAKRRILYFGVIAAFLALFFRASRVAQDWEAAAMGASLMLVLMAPASYYLSFVLAAALLATRRPRI